MTSAGIAFFSVGSEKSLANTVSGDNVPVGSFEIVAQFRDPGPSGVALTPDGRLFIGFPRHADNHNKATLAELRDGKLIPYPNAAMSLPSEAKPSARLVSVHGMTTDTQGRLWVIDDGKIAGEPIAPGAAKVVGIDPATDQVIASIVLKSPAMLPESHMNDLRVDLTHGEAGTAYIADSSFGIKPGLVVIDIASGRQRRVLTTHPSIRPEQGFLTILDGKPLRYDPLHPTFPVGGVDGITLSADSTRLYYAPLTSRRLYSIATALLSDFSASDEALAAGVVDEGEKGMSDGLATDKQNRIYITASEHDSILRRDPNGRIEVVARDPRIVWPDGIFATETHVYCTLGQWNRLPGFNGGKDLRQPPYLLIRVPITPTPEPRQ
ncbi:L-dopachrome tautomerase-related protein [Beijerinckia indica]|uniref:Putative major royal jelly-like protein n=1 Tax=Beijerinckia indica subsp. indica (strain ATCC 9039 / DSM 1715 / NCIMB 8712) TaxID=395963 RepID=B2IG02_BEII9|nr:L-dopachrome tautomerase-related protein [Beijerinckia indica]ACB95741.1 putative major royal jelly-like protein [Beijerinckia indica subsp. indica ATCC 9039]